MRRSVLLLASLLVACPSGDDTVDDTDSDDTDRAQPVLGDYDLAPIPEGCDVDTSLDYAPDARVLRWPYTTSVTDTEVILQWGLPAGSAGSLEWGATGDLGNVEEAEVALHDELIDPMAYHVVRLTGLEPSTRYCYRLMLDGDDLTGHLAFRTAPSPDTDKTIRWLVLGDYGTGSEIAQRVYDQIKPHFDEIDFWLTTGDNAYGDGEWEEWKENHFDVYADLMRRVPYFPTPGNHDYGDSDLIPMLESFELPRQAYREEDMERYYSFEWGPVHFNVTDSQRTVYLLTPEPGDDMMDWMRDTLAAAADRPWRVAAWHHPVYMTQPRRAPELGPTLQLGPAAEEAEVRLVLQGHNHHYERFSDIREGQKVEPGTGTTYVTSGGGGQGVYPIGDDPEAEPHVLLRDHGLMVNQFMLFEANRCTIVGRSITIDGEEHDRFQIDRCE